jgi:hypothetical protein
METEDTINTVNMLPPFSITFREALREFRKREQPDSLSKEIPSRFSPHEVRIEEEPKVAASKPVSDEEAITLFPRRKAGQSRDDSEFRKPLKLSVEVLESFFGVPLHIAARQLVRRSDSVPARPPTSTIGRLLLTQPTSQGICQTAIKKACR